VIFVVLFVTVSAMGFVAARWRRPSTMEHLDEWGLGGRNFGSWISWFLIGGDLYTAYTFVAVPALIFGAGATGFFAVPYTVIIYVGQTRADHHRVRDPCGVYVSVRVACPGTDRLRQGRADLRRHRGRDHLPAFETRRLGQHLRRGQHEVHDRQDGRIVVERQ